MRTEEEIKTQIETLRERKEALEKSYVEWVLWQHQAITVDEQMSLTEAAEALLKMRQKYWNINTQIRVLVWMTSQVQHFPWS